MANHRYPAKHDFFGLFVYHAPDSWQINEVLKIITNVSIQADQESNKINNIVRIHTYVIYIYILCIIHQPEKSQTNLSLSHFLDSHQPIRKPSIPIGWLDLVRPPIRVQIISLSVEPFTNAVIHTFMISPV